MTLVFPAWMNRAACRDEEPETFFPVPATDWHRILRALAFCERCPVREECLTLALSHSSREDTGIWGGTTSAERDDLRGQPTDRSLIHPREGRRRDDAGETIDGETIVWC